MIKGEYKGASLGTLVVILVALVALAALWGLGGDDACEPATADAEACD